MENWGLITFTEIRILVDPINTSLSIKQSVATIIAHEISHQWFGNLGETASDILYEIVFRSKYLRFSYNGMVDPSLAQRGLRHIHSIPLY